MLIEASGAYPSAVSGRPPFKLSVRVVAEDMIPEVDPAELAVVVVPIGLVRGPTPPIQGGSSQVFLEAPKVRIVLGHYPSFADSPLGTSERGVGDSLS